MPCDSSHLEPTAKERESREVSQLIKYVWSQVKDFETSEHLKMVNESAEGFYGNPKHCDRLTRLLCEMVKSLSPEVRNGLIFTQRKANRPIARKFEAWWEKHQEADQAKEEQKAYQDNINGIVSGLIESAYEDTLDRVRECYGQTNKREAESIEKGIKTFFMKD